MLGLGSNPNPNPNPYPNSNPSPTPNPSPNLEGGRVEDVGGRVEQVHVRLATVAALELETVARISGWELGLGAGLWA